MTPVLIAESVACVIVLALALRGAHLGDSWVRLAERALRRIALPRWRAVALVGLLAFGGSALVGLVRYPPVPTVYDEFSYLLAADTFASGRLTNPPHPLWVHFESIHVLQQPTYASKYPPAQGLALAAGQALSGHPIVGVWGSMGLACAALTWMLQAWLPPAWALLGGLLATVRLGLFGYWGQSYWGGAVAAAGGALLFGALRRLHRRPRASQAVLLGLGLAILANSRPYEGLLVSLVAGAAFLAWILGRAGPPLRVSSTRIVLPLLLVLAVTVAVMGLYNLRVTGDPLRLPYWVYEQTYDVAPTFLWQPPKPEPIYHHEELRSYYRALALKHEERRSFPGLAVLTAKKFGMLWGFYLGPLLTVPLVMLPWVLRDRWMRLAGLTCAVLMTGLLAETWKQPHYAAPAAALLYALVLQGMRHLRLWRWRGRPTGRCMMWSIVAVCVVLAAQPRIRLRPKSRAASLHRAHILAQLQQTQERHLVLVRYPASSSSHWQWVFNGADIDGARVVWAREMDPAQNRKLFEYFKGRRVWLLEADAEPPGLTPYAVGQRP